MTTTALAYAALATTVVSAGVSIYSSSQQAATQRRIAEANAQIEAANARVTHQFQVLQATSNRYQLEAQAKAQEANARLLAQQAEVTQERTRSNIERQREDFLRLQAIQRSRIAKAGVAEEGTPLEVLSETAGLMQLSLNEMQYQGELEARNYLREAQNQRYAAGQSLFRRDVVGLEADASRLGYTNALRNAEINRLAGFAQADAAQTAGIAQGVGTLASGAGTAAQWKYTGVI